MSIGFPLLKISNCQSVLKYRSVTIWQIVYTVKTLYNVTRYNRIFNIRHKYAGNRYVPIKISSLQQNIYLMTPTVTSGNKYTFYIENKLIITELLPCVRQFCDQDKVFCMNMFLSHLIRGKLCAF